MIALVDLGQWVQDAFIFIVGIFGLPMVFAWFGRGN